MKFGHYLSELHRFSSLDFFSIRENAVRIKNNTCIHIEEAREIERLFYSYSFSIVLSVAMMMMMSCCVQFYCSMTTDLLLTTTNIGHYLAQ